MLGVLHVLTLLFLGIPIFIFGLYGLILLYFSSKGKKECGEESEEFLPQVSIVVPTHNEELIISKKIDNMLHLDYPKDKIEMIFVDDSDDSTPDIVEEYSKKFPFIRLIKFGERMGYSPSMIAGCKLAKNEIIVFAEAGSFMDSQAIRNLVRHFKKPNIGLVTGKSVILNADEEIGDAEKSYLEIADFLRRAESNMDSTFWVKGEATAVRKELIEDLEMCNATFDNTTALWVRQKGYKSIYDSQVKFYEYAPKTRAEWGKQKTIRAANWIKILLRFRNMFFKRRYGKFGCITLPMQFSMLAIIPVTLLMGGISLIALTFFDFTFSLVIWGTLGAILLLTVLFNRRMLVTLLEFEYALLKALYQIIFTKTEHDKIDKVISTRTRAIE
jgi:cellulose synthase/poly-beta-1,6-N-acetylglucosamine synthase-like glycosyltransferase